MIKLFSAVGNGSPGGTKLLYTHYKMVARINRATQDVCLTACVRVCVCQCVIANPKTNRKMSKFKLTA